MLRALRCRGNMDMLTSLLKPPPLRDNENSSIADTWISDSSQLSGRASHA